MHHDLSHWEYVDALQGSQTSKISSSKTSSSKPSNKSQRHLYLSRFPIFLHDYIEDIIDIEAGGNYDFRAIGYLL